MNLNFLDYSISNYTAIITIDRPPVNALNRELISELEQTVELVEKDISEKKVRVVIISAKGKHFCAGADLKERMDIPENEVLPTVQNTGKVFSKITKLCVPTIAAMQGSAFGGGFELALAADIRVLVKSAQVGLRETALAIIPGAGGTQRLTRLIGQSKTILWITSAHSFSAEEALHQGAVNFVVPERELMLKSMEIADEIAQNGPLAVIEAKKAIIKASDTTLEDGLKAELKYYKNVIPTEDRIEGLKAFMEKRKPQYEGR